MTTDNATDARLLTPDELKAIEYTAVVKSDGASPHTAERLLRHIAALTSRAAAAERVIADIEKLSPVMISRLPVAMTYTVEFLTGVATHHKTSGPTLAAALSAAVEAAKGESDGT